MEARDAGIAWHETDWGLGSVRRVVRTIAEARPDLVHVEYPCLPYGTRLLPVILPLLLRLAGIHTVARLHEFRAARFLRRLAIAFLGLSAHYTLVPSEKDWRLMRRLRFFSGKRVGWLPNTSSVPVSEVSASQLTEMRKALLPGATVVGCYFGYFSRTKDVPTLCEAVRGLLRAIPGARFLMIGGGNVWSGWREELNGLRADPEVGDRITWSEYLSLPNISAYLQMSDFVLLPFVDAVDDRRTSFHAALEHALPTVTSGTNSEEQRYPAVIVAPGDTTAFVAAARRVATDEVERQRLASATRAFRAQPTDDPGERYEQALAKIGHSW